LIVGVANDELDTLDALTVHVIYGIAASASYSNHLDDG
jgi:hypothetical protein